MIACLYYRKIIRNSLDADQSLPEGARNHIEGCAHCREIYEAEMGTIRALRGAPVAESPSPFLHARIMSSLDRADKKAQAHSHKPRMVWATGLAAACTILLAAIGMHQRSEYMARQRVARIAEQINIDVALKKLPDGTEVQKWAGKLDEPLQKEEKLVINDAKTALTALADNFLPPKVRESLFEQNKGS